MDMASVRMASAMEVDRGGRAKMRSSRNGNGEKKNGKVEAMPAGNGHGEQTKRTGKKAAPREVERGKSRKRRRKDDGDGTKTSHMGSNGKVGEMLDSPVQGPETEQRIGNKMLELLVKASKEPAGCEGISFFSSGNAEQISPSKDYVQIATQKLLVTYHDKVEFYSNRGLQSSWNLGPEEKFVTECVFVPSTEMIVGVIEEKNQSRLVHWKSTLKTSTIEASNRVALDAQVYKLVVEESLRGAVVLLTRNGGVSLYNMNTNSFTKWIAAEDEEHQTLMGQISKIEKGRKWRITICCEENIREIDVFVTDSSGGKDNLKYDLQVRGTQRPNSLLSAMRCTDIENDPNGIEARLSQMLADDRLDLMYETLLHDSEMPEHGSIRIIVHCLNNASKESLENFVDWLKSTGDGDEIRDYFVEEALLEKRQVGIQYMVLAALAKPFNDVFMVDAMKSTIGYGEMEILLTALLYILKKYDSAPAEFFSRTLVTSKRVRSYPTFPVAIGWVALLLDSQFQNLVARSMHSRRLRALLRSFKSFFANNLAFCQDLETIEQPLLHCIRTSRNLGKLTTAIGNNNRVLFQRFAKDPKHHLPLLYSSSNNNTTSLGANPMATDYSIEYLQL